MQCCTCFKRVHLSCSWLSLSEFRSLGSFHSWSFPPASFLLATLWLPPLLHLIVTLWLPPQAPPACKPPLFYLALFLLMQHSCPTLVFKPLILFLPILSLLSLLSHHRLLLLAVLLLLLLPPPPDSLRVLQWNAGGLRARSAELFHFLLSHPVDLLCIQESNLNSSFFRIPGFSTLQSDHIHSQSGILSRDATHASSDVIIFVRQGLSFFELSTSFLSLLDPYSDYIGVNISFDNSSLSFLNVYAPYLLLSNRWQNWLFFFLHSFLLQKSVHSGALQLPSPPLGLKRYSRPSWGKYSIGSSLLTSSPSMTPTYLLFFIAPLAVAPPLTYPLLSPLFPFLAHGRYFRTWVLITYELFYLSRFWSPTSSSICLSLSSVFCPNEHCPFSSIFRKLAGMTLLLTLTLTVLLQRNTHLFLFPLLLLSSLLWHWMQPYFLFLLATSNAILKPGGLLKWKMRLVKDARLLLSLTKVMKIARLTSSLPDMLCL